MFVRGGLPRYAPTDRRPCLHVLVTRGFGPRLIIGNWRRARVYLIPVVYICTVYLFRLQIRIFSLSQYKRFPKIHRDTKVILTRDKCFATFDIYNTKIQ